jgi:uncharacterized protein (DUF1810 family)
MAGTPDLKRFLDAQLRDYELAWYIFPQIKGLSFSSTSQFYGINGLKEADAYLRHPVLGQRLINICLALLDLNINDANLVFGSPDDLKLKSSMTLFATVPGSNIVFQQVLDKFFKGKADPHTLTLLNR